MTSPETTRHGADEPSAVDQALGRLSPEAVRQGTGRSWADWLQALDAAGAGDWDHRAIVDHLESHHPEVSAWWQQSLAVAYERARGRRVVGQAPDAGRQIGVQRSVSVTPGRLWAVLTTQPDLWLGPGASVVFEPGRAYEVPPGQWGPGARGEVRVVKPGDRLRMTWQPEGWSEPATLQVALSPAAPGRTRVQAHLEHLPDVSVRETVRERLRAALERVARAAEA
ncbi:SRPBCC family protein [Blastococcus deserti]|uniref:SRPBCC domain-containing protein n=1 Tax=Blastococcus deserti TaxID=2259033 RepID=A0ABW4XE58_9ACTN